MEKTNIKEFKKKSNIEILTELMKNNNGYLTSSLATKLGIHRMYIKIMNDKGLIKKVGSGVYIDKNIEEDKYYSLYLEIPHIIYSHLTALYLQGYLDSYKKLDITVKRNIINDKFKQFNTFYVSKDTMNLGLIEYKTNKGNIINIYDAERSICDIIKSRKYFDLKDIKIAIRKYLKSKNCDLDKVYYYASKLGTKKIIKDFIDIVS